MLPATDRRIVSFLSLLCLCLIFACNPFNVPQHASGTSPQTREYAYAWQFLDVFFIFRDSLPQNPFSFDSPRALYQSVREPWTVYMSKPEATRFLELLTTRTSDGGIGIYIDSVAQGFAITRVLERSPVARGRRWPSNGSIYEHSLC